MTVTIDVSPGELIDKITILEIKAERVAEEAKRSLVLYELRLLEDRRSHAIAQSEALAAVTKELREVNAVLWDIEDQIRDCERAQDFGDRFVALARAVYHTNDRRAALKRKINDLLGSAIAEVKAYAPY
ncbi:MAG: DUF6165 family protein [Deltaproteobacteria bacterium]|nr:DUF6165 family protein [Deltaproteobacteria bacterium]